MPGKETLYQLNRKLWESHALVKKKKLSLPGTERLFHGRRARSLVALPNKLSRRSEPEIY